MICYLKSKIDHHRNITFRAQRYRICEPQCLWLTFYRKYRSIVLDILLKLEENPFLIIICLYIKIWLNIYISSPRLPNGDFHQEKLDCTYNKSGLNGDRIQVLQKYGKLISASPDLPSLFHEGRTHKWI